MANVSFLLNVNVHVNGNCTLLNGETEVWLCQYQGTTEIGFVASDCYTDWNEVY